MLRFQGFGTAVRSAHTYRRFEHSWTWSPRVIGCEGGMIKNDAKSRSLFVCTHHALLSIRVYRGADSNCTR